MKGKFTSIETTSESDWLERRKQGIGASEIASVLGLSSWKSALELYAEKTGELEPDEPGENLELGLLLEPVIIQRYTQKTGRWAERDGRLLRSEEHPWALCTLDARTRIGDEERPLEVKNWSIFGAEEWADGPPEHYVAQVQQQLLVTGADVASVACLLGGQKFIWCDVPRDEVMIRKIIHHGSLFWERVQRREPPDADGPGAQRALRKLFPLDDGQTIELPAELRDVVEELDEIKASQGALKDKREALEARIQQAMGAASRGILLGHSTVTWKAQKRASYVSPETTTRVLRISRPKQRVA